MCRDEPDAGNDVDCIYYVCAMYVSKVIDS